MRAIICDICKRPMLITEPGINISETVVVKETRRKFRRFINTGDEEVTYVSDIDICDKCVQRIKDEVKRNEEEDNEQ